MKDVKEVMVNRENGIYNKWYELEKLSNYVKKYNFTRHRYSLRYKIPADIVYGMW